MILGARASLRWQPFLETIQCQNIQLASQAEFVRFLLRLGKDGS